MACFHYVLVVFAAAVAVRGASGVICKSGEVANDMGLCPCHKAICNGDTGYYDDYTYNDGPKAGESIATLVSVRASINVSVMSIIVCALVVLV